MTMPETPFEARARDQPGVAIIDLSGEINAGAQEAMHAAYDEAEGRRPSAILLNFTQVEYINSTGIALIVSLLAKARRSGCRLVTYGLSDHYQEIFRITHLADFLGIFPNEAAALASVGFQEPTAHDRPS